MSFTAEHEGSSSHADRIVWAEEASLRFWGPQSETPEEGACYIVKEGSSSGTDWRQEWRRHTSVVNMTTSLQVDLQDPGVVFLPLWRTFTTLLFLCFLLFLLVMGSAFPLVLAHCVLYLFCLLNIPFPASEFLRRMMLKRTKVRKICCFWWHWKNITRDSRLKSFIVIVWSASNLWKLVFHKLNVSWWWSRQWWQRSVPHYITYANVLDPKWRRSFRHFVLVPSSL